MQRPVSLVGRALRGGYSDYGSEGCKFNSYWVHHFKKLAFSAQYPQNTPKIFYGRKIKKGRERAVPVFARRFQGVFPFKDKPLKSVSQIMKNHDSPKRRPARLPDGAPLDYAPSNELGVVFLFSHLARKFGLRVERVQPGFPDCVAYKDGKRVRMEFEFKSKNFKTHGHYDRRCDWIVCWEHNWPGVPKHLRVVELRREFGLGFNVWFQPVKGEYVETLAGIQSSDSWSAPPQAGLGDLLLFYRTAPESSVRDIFRVAGPVRHIKAGWKPGHDYMAGIRRVCTLNAPLHFTEMRENKVVCHAGFVRGGMQGRYRASDYWPELHRMIISRNPSIKRALLKYGPDRVK
jgi:hypothetical protein